MLGAFDGGMISLTGTKAVSLTNGTVLSADGSRVTVALFLSMAEACSPVNRARSRRERSCYGGGTIQVEAHKVELTDTLLTTSPTVPTAPLLWPTVCRGQYHRGGQEHDADEQSDAQHRDGRDRAAPSTSPVPDFIRMPAV